MKKFIIVETTFPNLKTAEKLAEILLTKKLAACIHFFPITSHYVWQKKIASEREILLRIKTSSKLFGSIEKTIKSNHPYELPQIISVEIKQASKPYASWLDDSLRIAK